MSAKANQLKKNTPRKENKPKAEENEFKKEKNSSASSSSSFINFLKDERFHKVIGLFLILFSFYLFAAFTSYLFSWKEDAHLFSGSFSSLMFDNTLRSSNWMGKIGAYISYLFIFKWFGIASYLFILLFFITGLKIFLNIRILPILLTFKYSFFSLIWISLFFGYFYRSENNQILGGIFGFQLNAWLTGVIGRVGTGIFIFFALACFVIIAFNLSIKWLKKLHLQKETMADEPKDEETESEEDEIKLVERSNVVTSDKEPENKGNVVEFTLHKKEVKEKPEPEIKESTPEEDHKEEIHKKESVTTGKDEVEFTIENAIETPDNVQEDEKPIILDNYDSTLDLSSYTYPTLDLLDEYGSSGVNVHKEELESNKNQIVKTLNNYAIQIEKIKATIGPTVTLYEIVPAPGVRISRIKNLEDDIALSLSALGIRIIAPIPGKGTIGIEVPNQNSEIVSMRSILSSEKFTNNNFELPIGLGKTISNECYVTDLTKMPHLLMAGATGQGKSVGLNAIIASLLYKKHPSQLKFVLVDPKKVELTLYSKIERHFLAKLPDSEEAIITDTKKVVRTLNSLCVEMDARYDLLKGAQVRNIKEYNTKFISRKLNPNNGHKFLPYIILIVDEFADLIMTAGKEIETPITRLAQLARAVGIHLIIATQRPSVNIITGTIKANFPARIAFKVTSKIDSRTILDSGGADQLIGRGDMLLSTGNELIRLQCAFVDTHEVEKVTDFIGSQRGYPEAFNLPEYVDETEENGKNYDPSEKDELFDEAARIIVTHQHGSTSLLQRKLKLGYNRAGRIIDQLEAAGIIGQFEGSKAREVKIKDVMTLEQFLKSNS